MDRYWCPEVVEPLLKRIDELVALKPAQALGLAEIALEISKRMRNPPQELRAHAYCSLATALRTCGRLEDAGLNFSKAEESAKGCPPTLEAMIARQKSLLLVEQGELAPALKLAQHAVKLDRSTGNFPTKSLIIEGIVRDFCRDTDGSTACFTDVLQNCDPSSNEYLYATNSLVVLLTKRPLLGTEIVEARKILRTIQDRIRGIRATPVRYVIWYTEGLLHSVMAEYRFAIRHFIQAREGFLRLEMIPDFARVSVDFVDVLVKKGDLERVRALLERTAKQISEFEEHARFAEAFRLALDQPLTEAVEFLRARIASGGAVDSGSDGEKDGTD